ncbi:hypothetical protein Droror1_Dr00027375 [Drosera rotundifolia]
MKIKDLGQIPCSTQHPPLHISSPNSSLSPCAPSSSNSSPSSCLLAPPLPESVVVVLSDPVSLLATTGCTITSLCVPDKDWNLGDVVLGFDSVECRCPRIARHCRLWKCQNLGIPPDSTVPDQLQEQESVLQQCFQQLKSVEASRTDLLSQLRAAVHDQV